VPTAAPDHRTEGLRALARLIADAVTPIPGASAPQKEPSAAANDRPQPPNPATPKIVR
jgi:hypothetical protein